LFTARLAAFVIAAPVAAVPPHREHDMTRFRERTRRVALSLTGIVWMLAIAPSQAEDLSAIRQEIEAIHERYLDAFNHQDAAALGALFAQNGIFVDQSGKITTGRSSIEAMFRQGLRDSDVVLEARADQIGSTGDGAWEVGHGAQIVKHGDNAQALPLHYTAIYQRQGNALRVLVISVANE